MAYLIDTDIIIYSLKNHPQVKRNFLEKANLPKSISVITYGELIYGACKSQYKEKKLAIVHRITEIFPIIDITKSVIETFGHLKIYLQKKGRSIPDMDLLIGSTALTMNYCLVTNNKRHFGDIPGLKLENWTE